MYINLTDACPFHTTQVSAQSAMASRISLIETKRKDFVLINVEWFDIIIMPALNALNVHDLS